MTRIWAKLQMTPLCECHGDSDATRVGLWQGEYDYLGAMRRSHLPYCPPPSAHMIRQLIVEHCILPLAAADIRQRAPETLTARSLLLYGPKGQEATTMPT
eukprot:181513-Amphidinium_carterae.1